MKEFDELGKDIARRWEIAGGGFDSFACVAAEKLEAFVAGDFASEELLANLCSAAFLPEQSDTKRLATLQTWRCDQFYIEVLFRLEPTTEIHAHPFVGAFAVVAGGSLQIEFDWEETNELVPGLDEGDLSLRACSWLEPGDVRPMGAGLIHSLAHVGRPTILIVVRTTAVRPATHLFLNSGTRIVPHRGDQTLERKLQLVRLAARLDDEQAFNAFRGLSQWGVRDIAAAFELTRAAADAGGAEWITEQLMPAVAQEHAFEAAFLKETLAQRQRENRLRRALGSVRGMGARLLLALLFSPVDRTHITSVLQSAFPDADPTGLICDWLRGLLKEQENPPLGMQLNDNELIVLEETLKAQDGDDFAPDQTRSRLPKPELVMFRDALRTWPILSPLFT